MRVHVVIAISQQMAKAQCFARYFFRENQSKYQSTFSYDIISKLHFIFKVTKINAKDGEKKLEFQFASHLNGDFDVARDHNAYI